MKTEKQILQEQLTGFENDLKSIQEAIYHKQRQFDETERAKIQISQEIERHWGALGYNNSLRDSISKKIKELPE